MFFTNSMQWRTRNMQLTKVCRNSVEKEFFMLQSGNPAGLRTDRWYARPARVYDRCMYVSRWCVFTVSPRFPQQRNRNSSVAQRGSVIHHSYTPESHIGFWSSGYDGFWRATSLPRPHPLASSARGRSVYCYVAFMHEPSRFYCHEHMTNYAGMAGGVRSVLSERKSAAGQSGGWGVGYWAKAEIDGAALSCRERTRSPPAGSRKPDYRFSRVFNYTLVAQTF